MALLVGKDEGASSFNWSFSFQDSDSESFKEKEDEVIKLQWAAIEKLPTFQRVRASLLPKDGKEEKKMEVVDVTKLGAVERHVFIDNLIKKIEDDNLRLRNLCVEAECEVVQGKPLPTLWNTLRGLVSVSFDFWSHLRAFVSCRMTLLLGPPGCGKTTLLQALAGKLGPSFKVTGDISYNGYGFDEFIPQKTSAYVSQYDLHIAEMTVRETLDFAACCHGIGNRADVMKEISRKEKQAGEIPDPDIDTYMKAISVQGIKGSLQTDYILKILGLDICADTIVGDAVNRGISGGQKKRLTTGEMIIGPTKALFMDEISNGLDTSTTFQIVSCLQHLAHITEATIVVSLLQPAPETFDLFDDIILMAEGKIVYHGARANIQEFFEHCGFRCPPRKGVADYLSILIINMSSSRDISGYYF